MKSIFSNLSFFLLLLFISGSYSQIIPRVVVLSFVSPVSLNGSRYIYGQGDFGVNPQYNIEFGVEGIPINIIAMDQYYFEGFAPLLSEGLHKITCKSFQQMIFIPAQQSQQVLYYYEAPNVTETPTPTDTPIITETPTPTDTPIVTESPTPTVNISGPIYVYPENSLVSSYGYFGINPSVHINITIGDYTSNQQKIDITYIDSNYFVGYAPPGYQSYQDIRIYNVTSNQLLYYGEDMIYYYPEPTQSVMVNYFTVPLNHSVSSTGYFGINPSVHINITIGPLYNQKAINITYINSNYFEGYAPSGYQGCQEVRIYNVTSNQLLYYYVNAVCYDPEPTSTPTTRPIEITSNLYVDNNGNGFINGTGYFGQDIYQLSFVIGDYYYQRAINIEYIDSFYFQGYAPLGLRGYQDIRIYNVISNELLYTAYNKVFYYYSTGSSSSSPTETPTSTPSVTPTASPSTPVIQCKYSSNGFYINSTESIQCHGTGPSYCETNSGSTCSTESNNSTIKCTTGPGSSSFYCIGNNIKCKSSYVTCSIEKPQSSYLLVNGIEQKSNYYDHSQPNNNINNNNQDNSSSASMIYSSLSLLGLLISSILIIV